MKDAGNLMEKIVSLCKRRGFIFPGSEIYGGLANSWDYGPLGVELKNNIKQLWWKRFVHKRDDMVGIDAALIMNPKVWEASGHLSEFTDPLVECKKCNVRQRADYLTLHGSPNKPNQKLKDMYWKCPECGLENLFKPKQFNLLFKTFIGPVEDSSAVAYLRGELAQAMFVDFPQVLNTTRVRVPFGIAAQGIVFRNEITPGNFIFRTREFDLMEFEYFIKEGEWEKQFEYWRKEMHRWLTDDLGISESHLHDHDLSKDELAHYSKRTIDIEYDYPFGRKELYGLAYRTDFDLKNHMEKSGQDMNYTDPETGDKFIPHVVEPTFGISRSFLIVMLEAYEESGDRVVLKLPPKLAPYKVAVFPLLANKPELVKLAREIYDSLKPHFMTAWDDRGNIGKRYYAQDEIGTPCCVTVDFDSLEDKKVTVRDRDTMKQDRVAIKELALYLKDKLEK